MEQLGFWELVHGTSAGCASVVAFESLHKVCEGGALLGLYTLVTVGLFKVQQWHLAKVRKLKSEVVS